MDLRTNGGNASIQNMTIKIMKLIINNHDKFIYYPIIEIERK
jgi:hypothetical protein